MRETKTGSRMRRHRATIIALSNVSFLREMCCSVYTLSAVAMLLVFFAFRYLHPGVTDTSAEFT